MNRSDLTRVMRGPAHPAQDLAALTAELEQARTELLSARQELFEAKQRERDDAAIIAQLNAQIADLRKRGPS